MTRNNKPKIGISIGDINGVGMEVIMKTFVDKRINELCTPIIFGSSKVALEQRKILGIEGFQFNLIKQIHYAHNKKINLINCSEQEFSSKFGETNQQVGWLALQSLNLAVEAIQKGDIDVLITAPINKQSIQSEQFNFPGHTEYFENKSKEESLMLMVSNNIRIGLVTGHLPLSKVPSQIDKKNILSKIKLLNFSLQQDFGIRKPKIAVLGLNPHSGDGGLLGSEEESFIIPAIKESREQNILAFGPYPADSFFKLNTLQQFDGILAMYHDQGLIPFKTLALQGGVNFTAGLSFIRTSPDHGTAFDIAGQNKADERSFRNAIFMGCDIFRNRTEFQNLSRNALKID